MLSTLLSLALAAAAPTEAPPVLVTTDWLSQHLKDPDLVLFQIGDQSSRRVYEAGHIPGAQFLNPFSELAAPSTPGGLALELPSSAQLDSVLEAKGVSNSSRIVIYSAQQYFSPTSRAFFTLEYAGLGGRVMILDGGLETWRAEGRPVTTEVPTIRAGNFTPAQHREMVVDASWVRAHLSDARVAVIDARDLQFYNGGENRQSRVGRIPGAANVPFGSVMAESGKFKDEAALRAILQQAGAQPGDTVVTYCHIGQQASLVWFAARLLGYPAKLYDGSFQDWSARREMPVEAPAPAVRDSMLVTADWLRQHLSDSNLVVLNAERNRASYDSGHVAGARFADFGRYASKHDPLTNELPSVEQLTEFIKDLGLTRRDRIVVYGEPVPAARLYFTLEYVGLGGRAALLDGGLPAWRSAGGAVSTEAANVTRSEFQAWPWTLLLADADLVNSRLQDSTTVLVDARSGDEFTGVKPTEGLRPGHIPGAVNLDWASLLQDGRFKPATELRAMFTRAGIGANDEVIAYCHSGARASVVWFVAKYLGWRPRMYDGSMEDWSRRAELKVEK